MILNICVSTQKDNQIKTVINNNLADVFIFPEFALTGDKSIKEINKYEKNLFLGASIKDGTKIYNEYIFSRKDGEISRYKKTHLGEKESNYYTAGDSLSIIKIEGISFGIAMCIESHIPEISKVLSENGAEVLIFPFATPVACGSREKIWNKYLPARAYDNNAFVIATNLYGGIMVIAPDGEVLIENYIDDTIMIKIDTEEVKKRRSKYKLNYNGRVRNEVLGKVEKYGF